MPGSQKGGELVLRGIAVSAGVCRGKVLVLEGNRPSVVRESISAAQVDVEVKRLERALVSTREQITEIQRCVSRSMGADEGSIFDAHLLVLEDHTLIDEVVKMISQERVNAEYAFHHVAEKYATSLASIDDDYLRERANDMRDVTSRILNNLLGRPQDIDLKHLKEPCIIVSHDLSPSNTAQLDKKHVLGFATGVGSMTSHTAIMARAMRIPALVGLGDADSKLRTGDFVVLDGFNGVIILNPSEKSLAEYGEMEKRQATLEEKLRDSVQKPAVTADGVHIRISANIEQPADTLQAKAVGSEGVGLFRTEYLFIDREVAPTEEQQYQEYKAAAIGMKPMPVTIRTLDLGGDKLMSHMSVARESNPFLGFRAIRFCLQQRDIFREQLRAILRASAEGNVRMMFPMISGLEELKQAIDLVEEYKAELRTEGIAFDPHLQIGAMIETPSAVMVAESLAKRLAFFSIGTNDLIQYSLAVDRMNEKIAHLYEPTHPAIVRLIKATVTAAEKRKIGVSVCGEMAADPVFAPLLLGLGVQELSLSPALVPPVKFLVRRLKISEARDLANFALQCESAADIMAACQDLSRRIAPNLFDAE